ncbi:MAG TPA: sigma-70 family RNA polymerase sigma factor [Verrucomicrobiae bacterium]|nr:sigma-70 family RNA polymerase sigma factor [Verrucomicrobiae bacterium]
MTDTNKLLLDYAKNGSDSAFRELVSRYLDLVYSVAFRRTDGNAHLAEDIAQRVFTDLARKAGRLPPNVMLGGWLHRHTCFVASTTVRAEHRRQSRERQAAEMNSLIATAKDDAWLQLGPVLDEAIDQLEAPDREAIVLRYFERRDLRAVGAAFGIGEDAAQKRVSRAVDKLRDLIGQRGATLSATILTGALASSSVLAAPAGLAGKITGRALADVGAGAGVAGGILGLIAAAKLKLVVTAVVIVAAVAVPLVLKKSAANELKNVAITTADSVAAETATTVNAKEDATNLLVNAAGKPKPTESGLLRLKIVTADSGQPIPSVPIDYRRWDADKFTGRKLQSTRFGDCEVSFPRETTTELELTTRVEGFADTRLRWRKDRGDEVPVEYTLRLDRATPIGGTVVDADGNAVAGAKVGFNHDDDPALIKEPESHEFGWIEVATDNNGQWRINRMADELIRRIRGGAKHPDYVDSAYLSLSRDPDAEKKLRAEKFVFQLGRPISVVGVVLDGDGAPVEGATVFVGGRKMSHKRTAKSRYDGSFTVAGCRPGRELVSAEAEGFATTTIEVAELGQESLRLVLQRGKLLRLRIVNQQGQPVPKASVWLDTMRNGPINQPRPIPVQADFSPRSDQNGLVVWSNAPDTELQFDIAASGYMRLNEFKVRPDGEEHVAVLSPALVVSGQVTDAETGKAIPHFRIVTGWPRMNPDQRMSVNWSSFERDWLNFSGGKYRQAFEDSLVHGMANPGYALKFEADGYAPAISRVIQPDEGAVQLDVMLRPAAIEKYTLLLTDGQPAANAEVGLVSPGVRLELAPGRFNRQGTPPGGTILTADKEGRVQLSLDDSVHTVMLVHPQGFLSLSRAALRGQTYLQLQPWGRIEGAVTRGDEPVVGREFSLEFAQINSADLWFGYTAYRAKTDAEGRFVFAQVPPGKLKLVRVVPVQISERMGGWSDKPEQELEVQPGETLQVALDSEGYTVKARVRWPVSLDRSRLQHVGGVVREPLPASMQEWVKNGIPGTIRTNDPQFQTYLAQMQAYEKNAKRFEMTFVDGVVTAEEVPAGEFVVSIFMILQPDEGKTNSLGLTGETRVTIPADPRNGTVDAGEIELHPLGNAQ